MELDISEFFVMINLDNCYQLELVHEVLSVVFSLPGGVVCFAVDITMIGTL